MELDLVVVGIAALFWCVTVGSIWVAAHRTSKRISSIEANAFKKVDEIASRYEDKLGSMFTEARPFLQKIEGGVDRLEPAITSLGNIEAIPATVVAGLQPPLKAFWNQNGEIRRAHGSTPLTPQALPSSPPRPPPDPPEPAIPSLGNIEATPAPVVAGLQPALKAFWNENVSPWATQMGNDALAQVDARIEKITLTLQPLVSVGAKIMGAAGGNAKAANARNREVADNIRGRIPAGLLSLLPKNLKVTDDAEELISGLMQFKPLADRFAPGLLDQFLFGGGGAEGTVQPTGILGMPGIFPGASVMKTAGTTDDLANYGK